MSDLPLVPPTDSGPDAGDHAPAAGSDSLFSRPVDPTRAETPSPRWSAVSAPTDPESPPPVSPPLTDPSPSGFADTPSDPIDPAPGPASPKGGRGPWIAVAAVVALLAGAGLGYAAAQPSKNDITEQKNEIATQLDASKERVAQLEQQVSGLEENVANAEGTATAAGSARDTCSKAATDAKDLIAQNEHLWDLWFQYMDVPSGSAEETQIITERDTLLETMETQNDVVTDELADCRAAVDG